MKNLNAKNYKIFQKINNSWKLHTVQLTSTSMAPVSSNSSASFSFSSSAIASSSMFGQKSPSKYGTSFAAAKPAINASAAMSLHSRPHTGSCYHGNKRAQIIIYIWKKTTKTFSKLECGVMPNVMVALPNIGGALCSTPQSLVDAHYYSAMQ